MQGTKISFLSHVRTRYWSTLDEDELLEARRKQININKCHEILKDILFNLLFLWSLFMVCYSANNITNSYLYQDFVQNVFSGIENVLD